MGAGQIGGIATLQQCFWQEIRYLLQKKFRFISVDIDFNNAAGFEGVVADYSEGQYVAYFLSHALLFCLGALIEPHVVLTPALCIFGERYKFDVFAGTHNFLFNAGVSRTAEHLCIHKGYNHSKRWTECSPLNLGLLVLNRPYSFHSVETGGEYVINRVRYGPNSPSLTGSSKCRYFGFGSRRNGFLLPLLIKMRKMDVTLLPTERCLPVWDNENQFLCIQQIPCKDDVGSVIECSGYAIGMMVSRLIDRPCGVGFIDLHKNLKFLTCGVDDARDVISHGNNYMTFDFGSTVTPPNTQPLITISPSAVEYDEAVTEESSTSSITTDMETEPATPATEPTPKRVLKRKVRSSPDFNSWQPHHNVPTFALPAYSPVKPDFDIYYYVESNE